MNQSTNQVKLKHNDTVWKVISNTKKNIIATASQCDGVILRNLDCLDDPIVLNDSSDTLCFDFNPDGDRIAIAGTQNKIKIYNMQGAFEYYFEAHEDWVRDLKFSPDGNLLASSGYDRYVKIWDTREKYRLIFSQKHHDGYAGTLTFSVDGKKLISGGGNYAIVWDLTCSSL